MKRRFPLILAILGLVVIIAAAAVAYKMYSDWKAAKETSMPLAELVTPPGRPGSRVPGTPAAGKTVKTKAPDSSAAGALPTAAEKAVPSIAYEYNAKGRRDPFATLIVKVEPETKKGSIPLENYGVNEFKLTAILWSKAVFYALVFAPDGKSFTLREGTTIGLHGGKVDKITKDSVIIKEFLKDYRGRVKPNYTILKLRREEEG
ncbi:MAG TPA: pilus assembly protein PilP [Dissulfurispiraceae bacterium]|nr:pilus assembly protein PilP [Dissulfurispiraceae bacterium]